MTFENYLDLELDYPVVLKKRLFPFYNSETWLCQRCHNYVNYVYIVYILTV